VSQTKAELIKGLNINASAPATALQIDASGNVNIDSNTLYVDATNNRVGIGTTTVDSLLHVKGTGQAFARIETTGGPNDAGIYYKNTDRSWSTFVDGGDGRFRIYDETAGSERAAIDSSGNVAIGTTPSNSSISGSTLELKTKGHGFISPSNGDISFVQNAYYNGGYLYANTNFAARYQLSDANHLFYTASSGTPGNAISWVERMRIGSAGDCAHFASSVTALSARNAAAAGMATYNIAGLHSATSTTNGTLSFVVFTNGNIQNTNGSYGTISDAKLKENIVDAGSQWDDFKAIQIRNWNFKVETGHETHRQIGPIAQELEAVCPGLVFETPDRDEDGNETGEVTKGVNQSVLYMKAVKALQEAMERIEQLETEMAAVKAQLA
jgi:hypothetical protein